MTAGFLWKGEVGAGKMAQLVMGITAKPGSQSSVPEPIWWKVRTDSCKFILCVAHIHDGTRRPTHNHSYNNTNKWIKFLKIIKKWRELEALICTFSCEFKWWFPLWIKVHSRTLFLLLCHLQLGASSSYCPHIQQDQCESLDVPGSGGEEIRLSVYEHKYIGKSLFLSRTYH